jgi:hypothetical protein
MQELKEEIVRQQEKMKCELENLRNTEEKAKISEK